MEYSLDWKPLVKALDLVTPSEEADSDNASLTPVVAIGSRQHLQTLRDLLYESHKVNHVHIVYPFVFLGCSTIPPGDTRPFTINGLLAIWMVPENLDLLRIAHHGLSTDINMSKNIITIAMDHVIAGVAVLKIANQLCPTCIAVSKIGTCLYIELPKRAEDEFQRLVSSLPGTAFETGTIVKTIIYHNGPIVNPPVPQTRPITRPVKGKKDVPKPALDIQPGAMLEIAGWTLGNSHQTPAGLLIHKDRTNRLTVLSYHHGEQSLMIPGTDRVAGQVKKGIKTDIGLTTLDDTILLRNEANVVNGTRIRALVPSKSLEMRETYFVQLPGAGAQSLLSRFGKRFEITRDTTEFNSARVRRTQSGYLTNDPITFSDRGESASACGAIILRYQEALEKGQTTPLFEACGIVNSDYLSPSQSRFLPHEYIVWADDFDELIEEGWDVY
ncbi:hypothetical protein CEP54_012683 [Fusarium duplospermum]|uniref:Uncharacterized protein n=1 Tax=Fusarium duplospermum TaxID=1325734 RepID=A0A428P7E6_9HYPO|nr:hypothetical protein CEP54_012683 [Fusarium duplospermum]